MIRRNVYLLATLLLVAVATSACAAETDFVVHISVDGLRSDAVTTLGPTRVPSFYRLRREGVFTDNARTDPGWTNTLPNHSCQLTGRGVAGEAGHLWTINKRTPPSLTLQSHRKSYVASVFDVVHDAGLRTRLYANKSKFAIFDLSWNEENGAPDRTPPDDGTDKIDTYIYHEKMATLVEVFFEDLTASHYDYVFLHLRAPDSAGHADGWDLSPGSAYLQAVVEVDRVIGRLLQLVESDPARKDRTAIVLTTDHGGQLGTTNHKLKPPDRMQSVVVPFYVWGGGASPGRDLYALNPTRKDPGGGNPPDSDLRQPIRNGDAANLVLDLLSLGPVPNSTINAKQDLTISDRRGGLAEGHPGESEGSK